MAKAVERAHNYAIGHPHQASCEIVHVLQADLLVHQVFHQCEQELSGGYDPRCAGLDPGASDRAFRQSSGGLKRDEHPQVAAFLLAAQQDGARHLQFVLVQDTKPVRMPERQFVQILLKQQAIHQIRGLEWLHLRHVLEGCDGFLAFRTIRVRLVQRSHVPFELGKPIRTLSRRRFREGSLQQFVCVQRARVPG